MPKAGTLTPEGPSSHRQGENSRPHGSGASGGGGVQGCPPSPPLPLCALFTASSSISLSSCCRALLPVAPARLKASSTLGFGTSDSATDLSRICSIRVSSWGGMSGARGSGGSLGCCPRPCALRQRPQGRVWHSPQPWGAVPAAPLPSRASSTPMLRAALSILPSSGPAVRAVPVPRRALSLFKLSPMERGGPSAPSRCPGTTKHLVAYLRAWHGHPRVLQGYQLACGAAGWGWAGLDGAGTSSTGLG